MPIDGKIRSNMSAMRIHILRSSDGITAKTTMPRMSKNSWCANVINNESD